MNSSLVYGRSVRTWDNRILIAFLVFSCISLGSSLLNVFIIWRSKSLRTLAFIVFCNKSVSDVLRVTCNVCLRVYVYMLHFVPGTEFSLTALSILTSISLMLITCSSLSLYALTIENYLRIFYLFVQARFFRNPKVTITAIWCCSLFFGLLNITLSFTGGYLVITWMLFAYGVVFLILPSFFKTVIYSATAWKLFTSKPPRSTDTEEKRRKRNKKITLMLIVVTLVYFVCQMPYGVMHIALTLHLTRLIDNNPFSEDVGRAMIVLNVCEPFLITFIYYQTSTEFQREVKSSLFRYCGWCPRRRRERTGEEHLQGNQGVQLQDLRYL